ncbi:MAG TPA: cellulose biosynthesis cyclic di-GMP-binding regulatory protein BcsB [Anaerolineales bacterium]
MKIKFTVILILLGLLFRNPVNAFARTTGESSLQKQNAFVQVGENEAIVTFGDLGFQETSLVSPFDSTRVLFSIPPNWRLVPNGEVSLEYEVTLTGADAGLVGTEKNPYGGSLVVTFNDELVSTIALNDLGPHTLQLTLPSASLDSIRQDGRHQLTISLSAQFSCLYNIRAIVVIKPTSTFKLPFEVSSPVLDLSRLPAPFHLRDALLADKTVLVVPNDPDAKELQAALNVMSGFGSLVGETFDLGIVPAGELTDAALAESNLIFVGRPEQFDLLGDIKFPLSVENKKFANLPPESETDGVLELAVSPWNDSKTVLLVGGNSIDAVLKAAQAISSGRILTYEDPALAYVADVKLLSQTLPVVEDFTLQSLGYRTETLSGIGLNSVQYLFNASKEQLNSKEGTIDLIYYHSGLLDYGLSSFSVELNNQVIASAVFSKETEQLTTLQIKIPPGILRFGENRLTVGARLFAVTSCDSTGFSNPWLTISDQSSLHLPATTDPNSLSPWLLDLKFYPNLFMTHSDLGDVAFVLPKANPSSWKIAGQMAYQLGRSANPLISNLEAVYADEVPQPVLDEKSLIVIGKSSTVPFLSQINDQLPAPFDFENDTASESHMQVVYRIPRGMSVGYLQLMSSPFNIEKPILVVAGNSDDGLVMAGNALLLSELRSQLTGVFAVTNGTQVATANASSTFSAVGTLVPPGQAVATTPFPVSSSAPATLDTPGWLLPVLIASAVAILLILGLVIVSAFARKREAEGPLFTPKSNGNARPGGDEGAPRK